jgi:hypothetical protein
MTHYVHTSTGVLEVIAEYPEKQPLEDGTFRSVMMVQVRDAKGHVTIMPAFQLEIISRNPVAGGREGTGPAESPFEWVPEVGLIERGMKGRHLLPETVGSIYRKPKPETKEEPA